MSAFRDFERTAVRLLMGRHVPEDHLESLLASATLVSCDHTGVGYDLTVRHPGLASERRVYHSPIVMGEADGVTCGFILFEEHGELTLECHGWGGVADVPEDIRERHIKVTGLPTGRSGPG